MKLNTALLVGIILYIAKTSSEELYACQYPGCECKELPGASQNFTLTCNVTSGSDVRLPRRNVSINIVSVTLLCNKGHGDPVLFLFNIQDDMKHIQMMILQDCVTSLESVFNASSLPKLRKLLLHNVTLSDNDLTDVISQRPLVTSLEVTQSDSVGLQKMCSLSQLSQLILSDNHITNLNNDICDTNQTSNLTTLDISHNDLMSFPAWIAKATSLTELYLQFNEISSISVNAFMEIVHLTTLDLSSNNLTSLPAGLLSQQTMLRHLNLSHNKLTGVDETLLADTGNLTHLDLSFNRLKYLSSDVFTNLHNIRILNLSSNSLLYLLRSHVANLRSLLYLNLGTNNLRNIPDISACRNLTVVDLRRNMIKHILGSSLRGLVNLIGIGLRHNRLTILRLADIAVSSKLVVLDFSHNNISYIDYRSEVNVSVDLSVSDSLSVLSSVKVLLLNNNQLKDIYRLNRVFKGLETLTLNNNQISYLRKLDFPPSLGYIDLSRNRISSMDYYMFRDFPNLNAVSLAGNYPYLSNLPVYMIKIDPQAYPKPKFYISGNLFLCNCRMAYLKTYFEKHHSKSFKVYNENLPTFVDLNIVLCITETDSTMRKLVDIPEEEFVCVNEDNVCEMLCPCCLSRKAKTCPCLHVCPSGCTCGQGGSPFGVYDYRVYCGNVSINTVPQDIPPPTTYLNLDNTSITELHKDAFASLGKLKILYLNDSEITHLSPGCFNGLSRVTHLYLNHNQLASLSPGMWSGLTNLTHLYLNDNLLFGLEPGTFKTLSQLQYLDLSNNLLTRLSTDYFPYLPSTTIIDITHNPLSCSCSDMRQTVPFVTVYGPNIIMLDKLVCVVLSNQTENILKNSSINITERKQINFTSADTLLIQDFDIDECNRNVTILNETRYEKQKYVDDNRYAVTLSVFCVLLFAGVVTAIVTYVKRREIQAWLFVKFGVRIRPRNVGLDETGRTYDAFVSYSSHDEHLVVHELAPRLEEGLGERHGKRHYHLCLHYRDFPVGDSIADTIIESIEASKRTIMLLSDNFLASEWCRYEFQTAHHHVLKESSHRLILVMLHEIDDQKLDPDLRVHLKAGKYLRYNDPWFWEKLYFELPDVEVDRRHDNNEHLNQERQPSIVNEWNNATFKDDQLDIKFNDIERTEVIDWNA